HQLQLQHYGAARTVGCELSPTRYDLATTALGGHGEHVERPEDLGAALERALASGLPACVNVMIDGIAAPTYAAARTAPHWAPANSRASGAGGGQGLSPGGGVPSCCVTRSPDSQPCGLRAGRRGPTPPEGTPPPDATRPATRVALVNF